MQNIHVRGDAIYFPGLRAFAVSLRLFAHTSAISRRAAAKEKSPGESEMFSSAMGNISNGEKFQLAWLETPERTDVGVYPRS